MKLLEKNNRIFIRFTALLLLFGSVLFYLTVNWIARSEIDEKLAVNQQRAIGLLADGKPAPQFAPIVEVEILAKKTGGPMGYADTMIFDPVEQEEEPYRQLVSEVEIDGKIYRITNRTSLLESEDLILAIGSCTAALALLLFTWMYSRSSKRLWEPFQQQLDALKQFSLAQSEPLALASSEVEEFEDLKSALQQLTEKVRLDYRNLKEFTENASHEIQTPLAIIRSKIEQLVENEAFSDEQMAALGTVYDAVNRLSRLNQSLLLLAKIENRQFGQTTEVRFNDLIREQVDLLGELTDAKNLQLQTELSEPLTATANRPLVEILIKNLLENAIRYSRPGDQILIKTTSGNLTFSNPGQVAIEQPERLFERFQKQGNHGSSLGLGLAIVREICGVYGWEVRYAFRDERHLFSVFLKK
ncbi:MAG: HAMP domain-containing histidine kinase [Lewinellaceae bacterium]|nr:HAMP domain-containing histidine kinase [Saprospiraceae bacterium]MCB9339353.1 HAMP domain-containing histidine kinase [Lewinellaceae bacterium]